MIKFITIIFSCCLVLFYLGNLQIDFIVLFRNEEVLL